MSFFSDLKPVPRAIGIATIAAAGCTGLYFAAASGSLESWGLPFLKPWQVLTLVSWAINKSAIAAGGRLDGGAIGPDIPSGSKEQNLPAVNAHYFLPAGWAFAIWAPILLGETALAIYQALPLPGVTMAGVWLSQLSSWLAAAFLLQALWCLSFRDWAKNSGLLWFPALLLIGTAVCLGGAHQVLRAAVSGMTLLQYLLVHLPISLHFGWVTCAALVNLNSYIALVSRFSNNVKFGFSLASIAAAVCLAVAVAVKTGDPVYPAVVAWALLAVAGRGGLENLKPDAQDLTLPTIERPNTKSPLLPAGLQGGVEGSKLKTEALAAKIGAGISIVAAVLYIFL